MDFAKILEQVRSQLKGKEVTEALGETNLAGMLANLTDLSVGHQELQERLHSVNEESKTRKLKIRSLEGEAEALQEKHDALASDTGKEALEAEAVELRKFKKTTQEGQRTAFGADFAKIAGHDAFVKAQTLFTLPKADDDGKLIVDDKGNFDFSGLSDDQMTDNVAKLAELSGIGVFDVPDDPGKKPTGDQRMRARPNGDAGITAIRGAKTMEELNDIAEEQSRA